MYSLGQKPFHPIMYLGAKFCSFICLVKVIPSAGGDEHDDGVDVVLLHLEDDGGVVLGAGSVRLVEPSVDTVLGGHGLDAFAQGLAVGVVFGEDAPVLVGLSASGFSSTIKKGTSPTAAGREEQIAGPLATCSRAMRRSR